MKKSKLDGVFIPNQLDKNPTPQYKWYGLQSVKNIEQMALVRKNRIKNALKN